MVPYRGGNDMVPIPDPKIQLVATGLRSISEELGWSPQMAFGDPGPRASRFSRGAVSTEPGRFSSSSRRLTISMRRCKRNRLATSRRSVAGLVPCA